MDLKEVEVNDLTLEERRDRIRKQLEETRETEREDPSLLAPDLLPVFSSLKSYTMESAKNILLS